MNTIWKRHITSPLINALGQRKAAKHFSHAPIFIGGCGRSGTSLLLSILSAHPKVFAFPREVDAHTEWTRRYGELIPTRIDRLNRALIFASIPASADRWCEKRPYNVRYIAEILKYYGTSSRFIHIIRDPKAVCTSRHPSKPDAYWISPQRWVQDVSAGLYYEEHKQVFTLRYEDLVRQPTETIKELCLFLELEFLKKMEHWYEHATIRENSAWFDGLEKMQHESLMKWSLPEHSERIKEIRDHLKLNRLAKKLGYK